MIYKPCKYFPPLKVLNVPILIGMVAKTFSIDPLQILRRTDYNQYK